MAEIKIIPGEVNTDSSPATIGVDKARFIRNLDYTQQSSGANGDANDLIYKTLQSNKMYDPAFNPGAGLTVGKFVSRGTLEIYVLFRSDTSRDLDQLYRIVDGKCQTVFKGRELNLQNDPVHFVNDGRMTVVPVCQGDVTKTYVIYTDSYNTQRFFCVEDCIATNSFNAATHPRFDLPDREQLISLGIPSPNDCISVVPVKTGKILNRTKYKAYQFRIQQVDVYGRPSEHGVISDLFYQNECGEETDCFDLTFEAGGPMVDKINVEFRDNCSGEWSIYETLSKYENCEKPWWERSISSDLQYDQATNRITYRFCGDRECRPVPDVETQRGENPLPLISESVFNMAGGIGLAGNTYGRKPFGCNIMDKVKLEIEKPAAIPGGQPAFATRKVEIWMEIFNPYIEETQAVWRQDNEVVFGGLGDGNRREDAVAGLYGQYFGDKDQGGFIGYLSNGQAVISKQYVYSNGNWIERGVVDDMNEVRGNRWMQKFEFNNIRPGKYIFRIAGHRSKLTEDYKRTSTYFIGVVPHQNKLPQSGSRSDLREITVNVCEKDYDSFTANQIPLVWDLTEPTKDISTKRGVRVTQGYIYESVNADLGQQPIEGARITTNASSYVRRTYHTDYNGFYFVATKDKRHRVAIDVMRQCSWQQIGYRDWNDTVRFLDYFTKPFAYNVIPSFFTDEGGMILMDLYASKVWPDYAKEECNRIRVKGKVVDCVTGSGLKGVTVSITRGQPVTTNNKGEYELIIHDYHLSPHVREVFFLSQGKCNLASCDGADCIPSQSINSEVLCPASCARRQVSLADTKLKPVSEKLFGLQLGGTYGFAIHGVDWMDRKNFRQSASHMYLNIPTINEMGVFQYPKVKWSFDPDITFPSWVKKLYFSYTQNIAFSDFITWVVDRFEFIDNTGNINNISPRQIKIYYSSLNEYNKQNNFSTNSTWQIIDEQDSLQITDKVQFIANGDGVLFPKAITELVKFDKDGGYFLIDFNQDLVDLKEGALIKLIRENECEGADLFAEVCESIDVVDGKPVRNFGYINAFDSYMLNRQIPTPIVITRQVKKAVNVGSDANVISYEVVEESESVNVIKDYSWLFEHHSPSDSWGTKCANRGRVGVKNEYEDVMCKEKEVALSGVVGSNGIVNYLHYFDERRKKVFDNPISGGIVAALAQMNTLLCVCETDAFLVPYDDNSVRVGDNGQAVVLSAEKQFGKPVRASGEEFGCKKEDRNTICFNGNVASWIDGNKIALIVHDFRSARNVSKDKYESFLRRKIKSIQKHNRTHDLKRYLHSHINTRNGQVYVSDFNLHSPNYIILSSYPGIDESETFSVTLSDGSLRKFCSFIPECYATLSSEEDEHQFFSFKGGIPYSHYNVNDDSYLSFYGVECNYFMQVILGIEPLQDKYFVAMEVYSKNRMYALKVKTQYNQDSRIPPNWFKRANHFWVAPFLCAENSVPDESVFRGGVGLLNGDLLKGKWVDVVLTGAPESKGKYNEITGIIIFANENS